jgi:hypothetical protein
MPTLQEILNNSYGEEKTAAAQPAQQEVTNVPSDEETVKLATELGIYGALFPEDTNLAQTQQTKTAEEEKIAEYQEALGARAYDYFTLRFDQRMSKVAGEIMSAADMEAAQGILQPTNRPPVAVPTNQDPLGDKAPMTPASTAAVPYSVAAGAEAGAQGQVGHEEQKMAAAVRKHLLMQNIG